MSQQKTLTERLEALTLTIQMARQALQAHDTPVTRETLRAAERAYRDYLMGLNGLPD